ncbi:MAG: pilus assembly protein N-terminal domain-containing protein [Deltaproteobacteria bacterium]|nr:pilus assembly protein N-terminal domain-containing protein [Deltaproteobacteria bacterium]
MARIAIWAVGVLGLALASGARADEPARRVELKVGSQQVFRVDGLKRISIGEKGVVDIKALGKNRFILFARKEGTASLLLFRRGDRVETWSVQVHSERIERFKADCARLLGADACAAFPVTSSGGKLVLGGRAADLEAYHALRRLKKAFPDMVIMTSVDPSVLDGLVRAINEELARHGIRTARMTRVGERLLIEGTVEDEAEKSKVEAIVKGLYDSALGEGR